MEAVVGPVDLWIVAFLSGKGRFSLWRKAVDEGGSVGVNAAGLFCHNAGTGLLAGLSTGAIPGVAGCVVVGAGAGPGDFGVAPGMIAVPPGVVEAAAGTSCR